MSPRTAAAIAAVKLGRSPGAGTCTCGADSLDGCSCAWGSLINHLIALGYGPASPLVAADVIPGLMRQMDRVLSEARDTAIRSCVATWPGTKESLARRLRISSGRLRAIMRRGE